MLTKEHRQKRIQELVAKEFVSTQSELVDRLNEEGVAVTQATVSRDISELRLVRLPMGKGKHRYALAPYTLAADTTEELRLRFKEFVRDVDRGENLVVIKTKDGHAMGIALVMDRLSRDDIVGTLAGQDTIFVTARTTQQAEALVDEFTDYLLQ
jgi:transcriptional regulator of arginine metabolism